MAENQNNTTGEIAKETILATLDKYAEAMEKFGGEVAGGIAHVTAGITVTVHLIKRENKFKIQIVVKFAILC